MDSPKEKKPSVAGKGRKASDKKPVVEKSHVDKTDKKSRKRRRVETFSTYIYKILRQVDPSTGISSKAMAVMNSFIHDIFERLASESSKLARFDKRRTLSSRQIQTAVRLILPGELARHAVNEGAKAMSSFSKMQKN